MTETWLLRWDSGPIPLTRPEDGHGYRHPVMTITAGLHRLGDHPWYWSVTGECWSTQASLEKNRTVAIFACGTVHDRILHYRPELKPVVDLHLSDANGLPMHCLANAVYWAGNPTQREYDRSTPLQNLAKHLRIEEDVAQIIMDDIAQYPGTAQRLQYMEGFIESQRSRWARESKHAQELLAKLPGQIKLLETKS